MPDAVGIQVGRNRSARLIPGRVSIAQRPAVVEARKRFGDWEGDTVYGKHPRICLLTQVERKSRYLIAPKVPSDSIEPWAVAVVPEFLDEGT